MVKCEFSDESAEVLEVWIYRVVKQVTSCERLPAKAVAKQFIFFQKGKVSIGQSRQNPKFFSFLLL